MKRTYLAISASPGARLILKPDFSCQYLPQHDPITDKTVQRVFECGGSIFLKEKVTNPGKAITNNWQQPQEFPILINDSKYQYRQHQQ